MKEKVEKNGKAEINIKISGVNMRLAIQEEAE